MDTEVVLRILLLIGVCILLFLPTVWAIRHIAHRSFPSFKAKAIWFAIVTLLPPLGALVYIAAGRPREIKEMVEPEDQKGDPKKEQDEAGG